MDLLHRESQNQSMTSPEEALQMISLVLLLSQLYSARTTNLEAINKKLPGACAYAYMTPGTFHSKINIQENYLL